jgi:hypothetical protein
VDRRSISAFLPIKQLSAQAIQNEFVMVLGPDAIPYSTVAKYLHQRQFPSVPRDPSEEPPNTVIDSAILDGPDKRLFSSIRELVNFTCIPTTTIR